MKLVHLRMRRGEDDVSLSDGEQFMVTRGPYAEHLAQAPERQIVSHFQWTCSLVTHLITQKSRCHNHRAQNNGQIHRQHLDCTGKGACACARHGAFIPHCVVDFQKGERFVYYETYEICVIQSHIQSGQYGLFNLRSPEVISTAFSRVNHIRHLLSVVHSFPRAGIGVGVPGALGHIADYSGGRKVASGSSHIGMFPQILSELC